MYRNGFMMGTSTKNFCTFLLLHQASDNYFVKYLISIYSISQDCLSLLPFPGVLLFIHQIQLHVKTHNHTKEKKRTGLIQINRQMFFV